MYSVYLVVLCMFGLICFAFSCRKFAIPHFGAHCTIHCILCFNWHCVLAVAQGSWYPFRYELFKIVAIYELGYSLQAWYFKLKALHRFYGIHWKQWQNTARRSLLFAINGWSLSNNFLWSEFHQRLALAKHQIIWFQDNISKITLLIEDQLSTYAYKQNNPWIRH